MRATNRFAALLLCFVLSGFAGLIYQTAWTQELSLLFGTSELALVTVLAAYMAGLALGALIAAACIDRVRRPVRAYALLELGIGVSVLAVPTGLTLTGHLHKQILGGRELSATVETAGTAIFYLISAFGVLLIPTALMGATLPILIRGFVTKDPEVGTRVGFFYTANTLGAAVGALATAFIFLPRFGLAGTIWIGVGANALVCIAAALCAQQHSHDPAGRAVDSTSASKPRARGDSSPMRWILPVMAISGAVSFTWEVLWTRLLSHVIGGSIYSFAVMLASFLVGIALGSALGGRLATVRSQALLRFAAVQLFIGALSLVAFGLADELPGLVHSFNSGSRTFAALAGGALMLPGTVAIGATFPLAVRILARSAEEAPAAAARVFAWNTVGAAIGALIAGYLVLPLLRFEGTAALAASASTLLALFTASRQPRGRLRTAFVCGLLLLLVLLRPPTPPWQVLRHSVLSSAILRADPGQIRYYGVGKSSTVLLTEQPAFYRLTTNGLPESSIDLPWSRPGRQIVARWLSLLPIAARPEARSILAVGLGAGVTVENLPPSIERIDVVELESEVVRANQAVAEQRALNALDDPRLRLHINDARGALRLSNDRFDVIVSQPSHPWTAGASNLFTREFFQLVSEHLEPTGIFSQWMAMPFADEAMLAALVGTLQDVFEHVELYRPAFAGLVLLASNTPINLESNARSALIEASPQWNEIGVHEPEDLLASRMLNAAGAASLANGRELITDRRNMFRTEAPRLLGVVRPPGSIQRMFLDAYRAQPTPDTDLYFIRRLLLQGDIERARLTAEASRSAASRAAGLAWVSLQTGRPARAERLLNQALTLAPELVEARAALLMLRRQRIVRGEPYPVRLRPLEDSELAVVRGWRFASSEDWQTVRTLEPALAEVGRRHPLYRQAVRLRARWRLASNDPQLGSEALDLVAPLLVPQASAQDLALSALAAAVTTEDLRAGALAHEALAHVGARQLPQATREQLVRLAPREHAGGEQGTSSTNPPR